MADRVTWFELPAYDVERAGEFYKTVFDWQASDMGGGSLMMQNGPVDEQMVPTEPGSINGDISPRSAEFNMPLIVVEVADMAAKLAMVEEAGGIVVLQPTEVPEMAMVWAIVQDTENNKIGLMQNL